MSKYIVTETTLNATLYCSTRTLINNDLYGGCFIVLAILASTSCVGQQHHRPIAIPRTFGLVSRGLLDLSIHQDSQQKREARAELSRSACNSHLLSGHTSEHQLPRAV